jgi:diaminopropionate ammonia-lyase
VIRGLLNARVRRDPGFTGLFDRAVYDDVEGFYAAGNRFPATPLRSLAGLARFLGIGEVDVKDESSRFGLNAFKTLGVTYAVAHLPGDTLQRGLTCATAGNHGRAVARAARNLGVPCTVFVPRPPAVMREEERTTRTSRIGGMRADGAEVIDVDGSYEDAVAHAAAHGARTGAAVVSDTAWPGYEAIPRAIMAGYTHLFAEASSQWSTPPDIVLVQGGVGGLVCAAASWFAWHHGADRPFIIACEPDGAACLMASAAHGRLTRLPRAESMMAGLRCAEPSPAAWPAIQDGVDAFIAVPDPLASEAMQRLASPACGDPPVEAGPSGACGAAALIALAHDPALDPIRRATAFGRTTRALAVVTEGW